MRDLDVLAPRAPLPKRALPDSVRAKLGLAAPDAAAAPAPAAAVAILGARPANAAVPVGKLAPANKIAANDRVIVSKPRQLRM